MAWAWRERKARSAVYAQIISRGISFFYESLIRRDAGVTSWGLKRHLRRASVG